MTTPNDSDAERELQRVEEIERNKMQDRTKAIVEAAERLCANVTVRPEIKIGEIARFKIEHTLADLTALAEAVALPSPQWTRTPPSEPGLYHMRRHLDNDRGTVHYVVNVFPDLGMVDFAWGDTSVPFAELANDEWWPVPIEEPPA